MRHGKSNTGNQTRAAADRAATVRKSVGTDPVLTHELTAASYKVEVLEALIAGHLTDAFEHITDALQLCEQNPSYTKQATGHFHTLPELLGAYVEACERLETPAARSLFDLFTRMEELGQARIH